MNPAPWHTLGENLGLAYQVADDLRDVASSAEELGKPVGQDAAHDRPSAVAELGVDGAVDRLIELSMVPSSPFLTAPARTAARARARRDAAAVAATLGAAVALSGRGGRPPYHAPTIE
jgi:geranylgeranyl diphosphate synthase type II